MTNKKYYQAVCTYRTECTKIMPVTANSSEEAKQIATSEFERWNTNWVNKEHGNPKELIDVRVIE